MVIDPHTARTTASPTPTTTAGSADAEIVDLAAIKAVGINIVSPVDNVGVGGGAGQRMTVSRSSSDKSSACSLVGSCAV